METRMVPLWSDLADRFARLILACLHREYPWHLVHLVEHAADCQTPRALTPAFYGAFDWHSAVHGHWALVRLLNRVGGGAWADEARAALDRSFTEENLAGELAYLSRPARAGFERPYGLAWLLQLAAELERWRGVDEARVWGARFRPLVELAAERFASWLARLPYPIRSGEHSQTAFAFGLLLDSAPALGLPELERVVIERSREFYLKDRNAPLAYEPSGHDFLSPAIAEADLLRRILDAEDYAAWLSGFLPSLDEFANGGANGLWLSPVTATDRADGKLAHLDGLNLSRAWMLQGVARGLPAVDRRRGVLQAAAEAHAAAGLAAVSGEHYAGSHWLGTFAVYLVFATA